MRRCSRASIGTFVVVALVSLAGCGGAEPAAGDGGDAGLATVFDSTGSDTVVARVAGEVPAARIRSLTEELRIQPSADDTSLFTQAWDFVVAPDGRMLVPDDGSMRIFVFDAQGQLQRTIGRKGGGPGEFDQFNGMVALPDGRLAVLDVGNARVQFFSATGEYETSWRVPVGFFSNRQLRTDASGAVRMALPLTEPTPGKVIGRMGLVRLGADGAIRDSLLPPDLGTVEGGYIARMKGGASQSYATHSPRDLWTWHRDGHFVAANGGRAVIEVGRAGRPLRIERDAPAVPVPDDEIAWERERITASLRRTDPSWTWSGPALPTTKAPISSLTTTRDGRIWVGVPMPSELIPESERDPQREGALPVARYRSRTAYEVYEASGRFVGRVQMPGGAYLVAADGDLVWVLQRDADGLPGVVRMRVTPGF